MEKLTVTLPCNPGQKAYAILEYRSFSGGTTWRISERNVNCFVLFGYDDISINLIDSRAYRNVPSETGYEQNISWPSSKIGKELFFSLDEAKEALREKLGLEAVAKLQADDYKKRLDNAERNLMQGA